MASIKIEYPGDLREKVDDFAFSLPGWWASGYDLIERTRDHAVNVPSEAIADAIASVLTVFGDDISVTCRN